MEPQTFRLLWQGIQIEIVYTPRRWTVIDHLEIRSVLPARARLPITETGYISRFMQPGTIDSLGGDVVAQVRGWLDDAAQEPDWLAHIDEARQGSLF